MSFASARAGELAVDVAGDLMSDDASGHLSYYAAPLSATAAPAAIFDDGGARSTGQIAFTPAGDLLVASDTTVKLFMRPFTSSSTPATLVTTAPAVAAGTAEDGAGNLYVANGTFASNLLLYAPPYAGAPTTTSSVGLSYDAIALGRLELIAIGNWLEVSRIDVYSLPLGAGAAPAFSIPITVAPGVVTHLNAVALDVLGNLYVEDSAQGTISVYAPPLSASSSPVVTVNDPSLRGPTSIAVGK